MRKTQTASPETITVFQLASLANLTPRRIRQLGEEGKIPKPENGRLPMVQAIRELFKFYRRDSVTIEREKLLKTAAQRRLIEHALARTEGQYLTRVEVARDASDVGALLRGTLIRKLTHDFPIQAEQDAPGELKAAVRTAATSIGEKTCDELLAFLRQKLGRLEQPPPAPCNITPTDSGAV